MRKALVLAFALAALAAAAPGTAQAGQCGLPSKGSLWIDVAGGPFVTKIFGRKGLVMAVGSVDKNGGGIPKDLRAKGAKTVYWDNYLSKRVGTPTAPADPAVVVERANRVFDYAVLVSGCKRPFMGENELNAAGQATPWSETNARYRANVLLFLRTLAARGARPFLAVANRPYLGGEAADWWRQVAQVADIVQEVYLPAPLIYKSGPILGSRMLRESYRRAVGQYTAIGIPARKIGVFLGFQTTRGTGGREGLKPARAWFEVVKLQALAAKTIASEMKVGSVWSWGWNSWSTRPQEIDPDKEAAACVYLWARNTRLCDGPRAAGPGFNQSLREGQLVLPRGVVCTLGRERIDQTSLRRAQAITRDREVAFSFLFGRIVLARRVQLQDKQILAAEKLLIKSRYRGSQQAYLRALRQAGVVKSFARTILADQLRRDRIAAKLRVPQPSPADVLDYYESYAGMTARRVTVSRRVRWLGGRKSGIALSSTAPPEIFRLRRGQGKVEATDGIYKVRPLGGAAPLAMFPLADARPAIRAALGQAFRDDVFSKWLISAETRALAQAICWRDHLPSPDAVLLENYVPALSLRP